MVDGFMGLHCLLKQLCQYNSVLSFSAQDDEMPFLGLKTNTRTQVYSGKKQTGMTGKLK